MVNYELEESQVGGYMECGSLNYGSYMQNNWAQSLAETTMPLKQSKLASLSGGGGSINLGQGGSFQASVESRSKEISSRLIIVNLVSLLVNLLLAAVAFYFSFVNNSPSTQAFAADCVLDFISSGIVLWRYYGDLNSVYMQAREQIACIYLGALFEISALAIIIKASSDMASGPSEAELEAMVGYDLVYLAAVATVACIVLTMFKCSLYKTTRDNSILLDVINTLISTVFAMSIIMSQALINVNPSFWYLDPILSILLALFMAGFGAKVIHQNFNILRPVYRSAATAAAAAAAASNHDCGPLLPRKPPTGGLLVGSLNGSASNFGANLNASIECGRANRNWQKTDYSTISFV